MAESGKYSKLNIPRIENEELVFILRAQTRRHNRSGMKKLPD